MRFILSLEASRKKNYQHRNIIVCLLSTREQLYYNVSMLADGYGKDDYKVRLTGTQDQLILFN